MSEHEAISIRVPVTSAAYMRIRRLLPEGVSLEEFAHRLLLDGLRHNEAERDGFEALKAAISNVEPAPRRLWPRLITEGD